MIQVFRIQQYYVYSNRYPFQFLQNPVLPPVELYATLTAGYFIMKLSIRKTPHVLFL